LFDQYDTEPDLLVQTAKGVTRKQRDILEDVSGELRVTVNLTGDDSKKTCRNYSPKDWLPQDGECKNIESHFTPNESVDLETPRRVTGVNNSGILWFTDSNGQKDEDSKRYFLMRVRYIYPMWKQV
jgi:hypothetical protein